ncbi:MAG: hypothetical protein HUU18_06015 [Phycisphaerales bacterium]|nr:hypothetical protein [Phycisphaerales bacterium]
MKRGALNSLAASLCDYLHSRNNDIAGYWGIGMLCATAAREKSNEYAFQIFPGRPIVIHGCEISDSLRVTEKLVKLNIDLIEGRLSFIANGRFSDGADKYISCVSVAVKQGSRVGMSMSHVECWPHEPTRERRRHLDGVMQATMLGWFKRLLG